MEHVALSGHRKELGIRYRKQRLMGTIKISYVDRCPHGHPESWWLSFLSATWYILVRWSVLC